MTTSPERREIVGGSRCPVCGKFRFTSRKRARAAAKYRFPGEKRNAYRCGDFWHIGTLPRSVVRGELARDEIRRPHVEDPDETNPEAADLATERNRIDRDTHPEYGPDGNRPAA